MKQSMMENISSELSDKYLAIGRQMDLILSEEKQKVIKAEEAQQIQEKVDR